MEAEESEKEGALQKEGKRTGAAAGRPLHASGAPRGTPGFTPSSVRRPPDRQTCCCLLGWEERASAVEPGCNYAARANDAPLLIGCVSGRVRQRDPCFCFF